MAETIHQRALCLCFRWVQNTALDAWTSDSYCVNFRVGKQLSPLRYWPVPMIPRRSVRTSPASGFGSRSICFHRLERVNIATLADIEILIRETGSSERIDRGRSANEVLSYISVESEQYDVPSTETMENGLCAR